MSQSPARLLPLWDVDQHDDVIVTTTGCLLGLLAMTLKPGIGHSNRTHTGIGKVCVNLSFYYAGGEYSRGATVGEIVS